MSAQMCMCVLVWSGVCVVPTCRSEFCAHARGEACMCRHIREWCADMCRSESICVCESRVCMCTRVRARVCVGGAAVVEMTDGQCPELLKPSAWHPGSLHSCVSSVRRHRGPSHTRPPPDPHHSQLGSGSPSQRGWTAVWCGAGWGLPGTHCRQRGQDGRTWRAGRSAG